MTSMANIAWPLRPVWAGLSGSCGLSYALALVERSNRASGRMVIADIEPPVTVVGQDAFAVQVIA